MSPNLHRRLMRVSTHNHRNTYAFIPSKFELPENIVANRTTQALEYFTAVMKSKQNRNIPFTDNSINNAIGVLFNLIQPTTQIAPTNITTRLRVSETGVQRPKVDNNNTNNSRPRVNTTTNNDVRSPRVLRPRKKVHQRKYSRGTKVYKIFGKPNILVEHCGYNCDFNKKEGHYTVKYQDGDTYEYNKKEI